MARLAWLQLVSLHAVSGESAAPASRVIKPHLHDTGSIHASRRHSGSHGRNRCTNAFLQAVCSAGAVWAVLGVCNLALWLASKVLWRLLSVSALQRKQHTQFKQPANCTACCVMARRMQQVL